MIKSFTPHQQYDEPSAKLQTNFCNPVANPAMLHLFYFYRMQ